ncbi:hypothetical protein [Anoxybacillus sp. MB8]|nr:hypothetical protein [Anoxybacillus sp. MB8]
MNDWNMYEDFRLDQQMMPQTMPMPQMPQQMPQMMPGPMWPYMPYGPQR